MNHPSLNLRAWIGTMLLLRLAAPSVGQTTRAIPQPSAPRLEVHEWAVFVLDAAANEINPDGLVKSTLPSFINSRRAAAPPGSEDKPSPVGVVRLVGSSDSPVDVKIEKVGGTFQSSWPKGRTRSNQLLWQDLTLAAQPQAGRVQDAEHHWFSRLRNEGVGFVEAKEGPAEQFLLYEVAMPYTCPLHLKESKDFTAELRNEGKLPLHDLVLYQPDHGGWRTATVGDLAVSTLPGAASTRPATAPSNPTTSPSTQLAVATTRPATVPATAPSSGGVVLRPSASTQPSDLAAPWKPILVREGISPSDSDLIVEAISQYALSGHATTAVYRMDQAEFERILPMEVLPQPNKIVRVGLVIVRNADPSAISEVDELIAQLGDPDWSKREAAFAALKSFGSAAFPKLKAATKNSDLEIVWRAEKLVAEGEAH